MAKVSGESTPTLNVFYAQFEDVQVVFDSLESVLLFLKEEKLTLATFKQAVNNISPEVLAFIDMESFQINREGLSQWYDDQIACMAADLDKPLVWQADLKARAACRPDVHSIWLVISLFPQTLHNDTFYQLDPTRRGYPWLHGQNKTAWSRNPVDINRLLGILEMTEAQYHEFEPLFLKRLELLVYESWLLRGDFDGLSQDFVIQETGVPPLIEEREAALALRAQCLKALKNPEATAAQLRALLAQFKKMRTELQAEIKEANDAIVARLTWRQQFRWCLDGFFEGEERAHTVFYHSALKRIDSPDIRELPQVDMPFVRERWQEEVARISQGMQETGDLSADEMQALMPFIEKIATANRLQVEMPHIAVDIRLHRKNAHMTFMKARDETEMITWVKACSSLEAMLADSQASAQEITALFGRYKAADKAVDLQLDQAASAIQPYLSARQELAFVLQNAYRTPAR